VDAAVVVAGPVIRRQEEDAEPACEERSAGDGHGPAGPAGYTVSDGYNVVDGYRAGDTGGSDA
jgi:hypothetical protein